MRFIAPRLLLRAARAGRGRKAQYGAREAFRQDIITDKDRAERAMRAEGVKKYKKSRKKWKVKLPKGV